MFAIVAISLISGGLIVAAIALEELSAVASSIGLAFGALGAVGAAYQGQNIVEGLKGRRSDYAPPADSTDAPTDYGAKTPEDL